MKASDLTEEQQIQFAEEFYLLVDFDDTETANPFGCPWIWDKGYEFKETEIDLMAQEFYDYHKEHINELIKEQQENDKIKRRVSNELTL